MDRDWIIAGSVVGDEEGPPFAVTLVLVAAMEDIAVEEESISWLHLHLHQGKHLHSSWIEMSVHLVGVVINDDILLPS